MRKGFHLLNRFPFRDVAMCLSVAALLCGVSAHAEESVTTVAPPGGALAIDGPVVVWETPDGTIKVLPNGRFEAQSEGGRLVVWQLGHAERIMDP